MENKSPKSDPNQIKYMYLQYTYKQGENGWHEVLSETELDYKLTSNQNNYTNIMISKGASAIKITLTQKQYDDRVDDILKQTEF